MPTKKERIAAADEILKVAIDAAYQVALEVQVVASRVRRQAVDAAYKVRRETLAAINAEEERL